MAQVFTDSNINDIIASGKPVMVDFWATWCGPCRAMGPVVDKLAEEFEGKIEIGKYNCDDETEFATENRVMSLPTFPILLILSMCNVNKNDYIYL